MAKAASDAAPPSNAPMTALVSRSPGLSSRLLPGNTPAANIRWAMTKATQIGARLTLVAMPRPITTPASTESLGLPSTATRWRR